MQRSKGSYQAGMQIQQQAHHTPFPEDNQVILLFLCKFLVYEKTLCLLYYVYLSLGASAVGAADRLSYTVYAHAKCGGAQHLVVRRLCYVYFGFEYHLYY